MGAKLKLIFNWKRLKSNMFIYIESIKFQLKKRWKNLFFIPCSNIDLLLIFAIMSWNTIKEYVLPFTLKLNLSQSLCPLFHRTFNTFLLKRKRETISILCSLQDFFLFFSFFFDRFQILLKKFLPFSLFVLTKFHSSKIFKTNVERILPRVKNVSLC